jgi:hypothetical protein
MLHGVEIDKLSLIDHVGSPPGVKGWDINAFRAEHGSVLIVTDLGRAVVGLGDGRVIWVPLPDRLRGGIEAGVPVTVYLALEGHVVGWYVPELELGVDMRH